MIWKEASAETNLPKFYQLASIQIRLNNKPKMLADTQASKQHFLEPVTFIGRKYAVVDIVTLAAFFENQGSGLPFAAKK